MRSNSFRTVRWIRTLNLVLQAVLFLTLFGGLNYLAKHYAPRFDLTEQRKFSLSPETLSYVKNLQRPVHIVVTVSDETDSPEIKGLLQEFVYATEGRDAGKITTETLDVYQNRRRAEELGIDTAGVIVIISGDKRRALRVGELYAMKGGQRDRFEGEQVITAAILDVSTGTRKKIYFVVGHQELRPELTDERLGLSTVRDQLKLRNFDVESIDLTVARRVPADASLLIIAAPRTKYSRAEQELLRQYLSADAGRMILFLAPGISTVALGLDDLLLDWGVIVHDDFIVDPGPENMAENFDLLIRAFAPHPITRSLIENGEFGDPLRLGAARTVMPDPGRTLGSGLNTVTIAATSKSAWGERDFRPNVQPRYDPGIDTRPLPVTEPPDRLGVVVASERRAVRGNLPFSVPAGKLVVFGTGDLVANARIANNLGIFLNTVNWAVERDRQLNIPPRPVERFQLSLSAADFTRLRYALLLVLPGAALGLGLLVYWTRRT